MGTNKETIKGERDFVFTNSPGFWGDKQAVTTIMSNGEWGGMKANNANGSARPVLYQEGTSE